MPVQMLPVSFPNQDGQRLFGIVHRPSDTAAIGTAVLLLSPGVKMRVAPHRLYNKIADRFVALGYTVLRFDFHGLGDAEGDAPETHLADLYAATQAGRYVPDTVAAMDWMQRTYGFSSFVAAGLCGGALTGLLAAEHDERIASLIALSIPVIIDGTGVDAAKYMTVAQLELTRDAYLKRFRLWDAAAWHSWRRFLTGRSDYRQIVRSLVRPLRARRDRVVAGPTAETPPTDNTNPRFAPAFHRMASTSRPMLLVFAESDRLYAEFQAKFMTRHEAWIERYRPWFHVHVTPQANHIFSMDEWQRDALDQCANWLQGVRRSADATAGR